MEGVLSFNLKSVPVKFCFGIEILADGDKNIPAGVRFRYLHMFQKINIIDPVDQIVFVAEMVVKAFAVDSAFPADFPHAYF